MDAPTCRLCGKPHWNRLCYGPEDVTPTPVTRPVTVTEIVTDPVTPIVTPGATSDVPRSVAPSKLMAAVAEIETLRFDLKAARAEIEIADGEIERLRYEVMHLKKLLANEHQKTVPVEDRNRIAMTGAERVRKLRERRKADGRA